MILEQETIKKAKGLGLNTYEVKIWTALLSRGVSTAGELSDIANVPRSRSYDVLESLEKKGFVVMKLGKPIKYLAVPPREVLERVKVKIEDQTKKHITEISKNAFVTIIDKLQEMHENSGNDIQEVVAVIKGTENIDKHLQYLFNNAQNEVTISSEIGMVKYGSFIPKGRNIQVKTPSTPARFCVVDENLIIFPVNKEEVHPDYDLCIWVKHKGIANFMKKISP